MAVARPDAGAGFDPDLWIITLAPGDPVRMKIGFEATAQEVAAERERLGLERPMPVRYVVWVRMWRV